MLRALVLKNEPEVISRLLAVLTRKLHHRSLQGPTALLLSASSSKIQKLNFTLFRGSFKTMLNLCDGVCRENN